MGGKRWGTTTGESGKDDETISGLRREPGSVRAGYMSKPPRMAWLSFICLSIFTTDSAM